MPKKKSNSHELLLAFEEATKLSFSLALLPVLLLIGGVTLDSMLRTKPLFILLSIGLGVITGIFMVFRASKMMNSKKL